MRPLHLVALIIVFMLLAPLVYGGEHYSNYRLDPHQDDFYKKFGGRVYLLRCGRTSVNVFKRADGKRGYFSCLTGRTSANAYIVVREGRRWVRQR